MEGNVRFKIDWASLIVFEGNFQVQAPGGGGGGNIWRGDLTEGFLRYDFRGLIHGGAYFRNFYGTLQFAILDNNCIFFVFIDNYRLLYFSTKMWFMK